jgi:hypothetical protein
MPTKKPKKLCRNSWHSSRDSSDVAPSDYHLFGKLKESLPGTRFEEDDAIITATKQWFRRTGPKFDCAGLQALVPRWHKAVERDGDYVEK